MSLGGAGEQLFNKRGIFGSLEHEEVHNDSKQQLRLGESRTLVIALDGKFNWTGCASVQTPISSAISGVRKAESAL